MHFYKKKGRVNLDLKGNLVLTKNEKLVTCASKSALPYRIHGGHKAIVKRGGRVRATISALNFIWSK